jgi:hypothetical protein
LADLAGVPTSPRSDGLRGERSAGSKRRLRSAAPEQGCAAHAGREAAPRLAEFVPAAGGRGAQRVGLPETCLASAAALTRRR